MRHAYSRQTDERTHLPRFRQLTVTAHPVEVHDTLRRVVVSQNFGNELAEPGDFALCELDSCHLNSNLV
jgi:transposase